MVLNSAALLVVGAAVVAAVVVLARAHSVRQALPVLLEFLTAAGLLRLAAVPTWSSLAVTAAIIALRRLVAGGVRAAAASALASADPPGRGRSPS